MTLSAIVLPLACSQQDARAEDDDPGVDNARWDFHNHQISLPLVPEYTPAGACGRHVSNQGGSPEDKNGFPAEKSSKPLERNDDHGLRWINDEWFITGTFTLSPIPVGVNVGIPIVTVPRILPVVRGYSVEGLPTVRRLLGNRCIEHDEIELVRVLDQYWYAHRGKQSKLIYEDELGSQKAEKVIFYAGPLEDLKWWGD